jgi:hypothetical protein
MLEHSPTLLDHRWPAGQYMDPVQTADERFLLDTEFSGRERLLIAKPGEDYVPFAPVFSLRVSDSVQRNSLVWMVIIGIIISEFLGVQPNNPSHRVDHRGISDI